MKISAKLMHNERFRLIVYFLKNSMRYFAKLQNPCETFQINCDIKMIKNQ